jgi:hypothetical protein
MYVRALACTQQAGAILTSLFLLKKTDGKRELIAERLEKLGTIDPTHGNYYTFLAQHLLK